AFDSIPADERRRRDVVWVEPEVVIEADFRGWTHGDVVRQAAFKGVREDKSPREVVREVPADMATIARTASQEAPRTRGRKTARGATARAAKSAARPKAAAVEIGKVRLSHPDRVYWDDVGVTKQALAEFYADIWDWIAPHVVRRPLALLRCPDGVGTNCFVQKHAH